MAQGIKTGGREAGTPNKLTKELREILKTVIESEIELLPGHLEQLKPKERLEVLTKLLPFIIPKMEENKLSLTSEQIEVIVPGEDSG